MSIRSFIEEAERAQKKAESMESEGNLRNAFSLYRKAATLYIVVLEENAKLPKDIKKIYFNRVKKLEKKIKELKEKINGNILKESEPQENKKKESLWLIEEKPNIRFSDIVGLEDVKETIKMRVIYPIEHPEEAEAYGVGIGGGILFFGPPGTGKTMLAKAIANEVDASFFLVTGDSIMNKWVGESEKNIARVFQSARTRDRSIIFFDEIESIAPKRNTNSTVVPRVVTQLLTEMDGFSTQKNTKDKFLLVIAATNLIDQIDKALLRPGRFTEKIYVGLPDLKARERMFELKLKDKYIDKNINYKRLAELSEGYTGADIQYIVQKAGEIVFKESIDTGKKRSITQEDLEKVIKSTPKSVSGKLLKKYEEYKTAFAFGGG